MAVLLLPLLIAGCEGKAEIKEPEVDIFPVQSECRTDQAEACCSQECILHCNEDGFSYYKHMLNGFSCACWCQ